MWKGMILFPVIGTRDGFLMFCFKCDSPSLRVQKPPCEVSCETTDTWLYRFRMLLPSAKRESQPGQVYASVDVTACTLQIQIHEVHRYTFSNKEKVEKQQPVHTAYPFSKCRWQVSRPNRSLSPIIFQEEIKLIVLHSLPVLFTSSHLRPSLCRLVD